MILFGLVLDLGLGWVSEVSPGRLWEAIWGPMGGQRGLKEAILAAMGGQSGLQEAILAAMGGQSGHFGAPRCVFLPRGSSREARNVFGKQQCGNGREK